VPKMKDIIIVAFATLTTFALMCFLVFTTYKTNKKNRWKGFLLSAIATIILLVAVTIGIVSSGRL